MKTFLKIVLFIVVWFLTMAVLMYIWLDVQGNELTKFPFYYSIISLIVPYIAVYRYKLLDKIKNIKIPKASTNKKNDTPIKVDSKTFGVIGVIILIGCLYYYSDKIFVRKVIFNDDLIGDYDCRMPRRCDDLVKWKKDSTLFTGIAEIYDTKSWGEIHYYRGLKHGVEKGYYGNVLVWEANYKYGINDGLKREWNENGQLESEENYKNGEQDGLKREWDENGQLYLEVNYKNGEPDGLARIWYVNGQLHYEENYKNGKREGLLRYWYENGQLKSETNYKNGERDGLLRAWYENGQLESEENYKNGEQDGLRKSWYENGQLNFEENYKNNMKEGLQKYWNENGQLKKEENYNNGQIVRPAIYYFNRALKKSKNKNHSGAIADYTKAIALNPNYAEAYYERGHTKFYLNDKNGACEDWEIALQMGYELARLAFSSKIGICN